MLAYYRVLYRLGDDGHPYQRQGHELDVSADAFDSVSYFTLLCAFGLFLVSAAGLVRYWVSLYSHGVPRGIRGGHLCECDGISHQAFGMPEEPCPSF